MTAAPQFRYKIHGMDCANCAKTLELSIAQMDGVKDVQVNFTSTIMEGTGTPDTAGLLRRVRALGYDVVEEASGAPQKDTPSYRGVAGFIRFLLAERRTAIALAAAVLMLASLPLSFIDGTFAHRVLSGIHIMIALMAGLPIVLKGVRSLFYARRITIDLLMSVATVGAFIIGETGEAATVIVLFAIGETLEGYTAERARDSLRGLLALAPDEATVLRQCIDCAEHLGQEGYTGGPCPFCGTHMATVPVSEVLVGERVVVRPGQRIPVDGRVLSGESAINQAPVTGESLPVNRKPGDPVFAGTINGDGVLEVEVERAASDSTISRIVRLVEQAQSQRSSAERFIDRFAGWYTPLVVVLAALVALVPPLLLGGPLLDTPDTHGWLYRAFALLIIACPCALVISTPVTVVSTLTSLARRGVLVKGGAFLDTLSRVKTFAFDKTGTLTEGRPVVAVSQSLGCPPEGDRCDNCDELVTLAAALEAHSEHPLAHAVVAEAAQRGLSYAHLQVTGIRALAGRGVEGQLDGQTITIGSHTLIHERYSGACSPLHAEVAAAERGGQTAMVISQDAAVLGYITVADRVRESSREALTELKRTSPEIRTVMLTGDNPAAAQAVAAQAGSIDEVRAGLLPEDKLEAVRGLERRYGAVAMVGDGINDTPALAAASLGIALGGAGTAQAMETADIVLMQDGIARLPEAVRASRRARRIIQQNIALSLGLKAIFLALAIPGLATMWMAVFADMGASLLVTLNGMRMLRDERQGSVTSR
ncbi:MAG: cation-translocating P-type ATPase [Anaerolineae bacterium]|nr:cation-translocating P-type ATPase [Anaerolineae bacterium]